MEETQFQTIIKDPAARKTQYRAMVSEYFDRITETYREKWSESFHFAIFDGDEPLEQALVSTERKLVEEANLRPGMKVLDVGCGVGGPALNIADFADVDVTGVNICESQLAIARERAVKRNLADRTRFLLCDAMHMDFPDDSFDAVYLFEAGCHMPDKPSFYKECARVLKPGGVFFGQDWFKKHNPTPQEDEKFVEPICRLFSVPNMVSLVELDEQLKAAGLSVSRCQNMAEHGNIFRNWELLDGHVIRALHGWLPWLIPSTLRLLTDGGMVLSKAARAGVFIIGQWCAQKTTSLALKQKG
ncbi:MAG: methyltransferase domain-containing protein [Planctomycetes bacterium]|nr:methyltransferase domain-containing protein [Planctomycetota bacterium]